MLCAVRAFLYCSICPSFEEMCVLVTFGFSNRSSIASMASSSSSHSHIQPGSASGLCAWLSGPSRLGMNLRRHWACVVPFMSVPLSLHSVYELNRWSVTILDGDQGGSNLALIS